MDDFQSFTVIFKLLIMMSSFQLFSQSVHHPLHLIYFSLQVITKSRFTVLFKTHRLTEALSRCELFAADNVILYRVFKK